MFLYFRKLICRKTANSKINCCQFWCVCCLLSPGCIACICAVLVYLLDVSACRQYICLVFFYVEIQPCGIMECSILSSHVSSSGLVSSKLCALVAATANWVVHCKVTQFAMATTNHSTLSSDEVKSAGMRSWVIRTLPLLPYCVRLCHSGVGLRSGFSTAN